MNGSAMNARTVGGCSKAAARSKANKFSSEQLRPGCIWIVLAQCVWEVRTVQSSMHLQSIIWTAARVR